MADNFKWNGDDIKKQIKLDLIDKLDFAGLIALDNAQKIVGRDQPRGKTKSGERIGLDPSTPGTPPKRVTGNLQRSINWDLDRNLVIGRIGTPLRYGKHLQLGTRTVAPRPWLNKAINASKNKMRNIFNKEMKS